MTGLSLVPKTCVLSSIVWVLGYAVRPSRCNCRWGQKHRSFRTDHAAMHGYQCHAVYLVCRCMLRWILIWLACLAAPQAYANFSAPMSKGYGARAFADFDAAFGGGPTQHAPAAASAPSTEEDVANPTSAENVREATNALTRIEKIGRPSTRDPNLALKDSKRRTMLPALRNVFEAALNYTNQTLLGGDPSVQVSLVEVLQQKGWDEGHEAGLLASAHAANQRNQLIAESAITFAGDSRHGPPHPHNAHTHTHTHILTHARAGRYGQNTLFGALGQALTGPQLATITGDSARNASRVLHDFRGRYPATGPWMPSTLTQNKTEYTRDSVSFIEMVWIK